MLIMAYNVYMTTRKDVAVEQTPAASAA